MCCLLNKSNNQTNKVKTRKTRRLADWQKPWSDLSFTQMDQPAL